ncbi:MAG: hypothetical protein GX795_12040 [Firmicutes bacterium]|jgi:hypothetical protein|nr:hypothetical protein [Bacillota bacterium]
MIFSLLSDYITPSRKLPDTLQPYILELDIEFSPSYYLEALLSDLSCYLTAKLVVDREGEHTNV